MASQPAKVEFNTFVKGIITEANPLTFPENSSVDERNFVLNVDGSRQRRLGMDYEEEEVLHDLETIETVIRGNNITSYRWDNVGNSPTESFVVVQVGNCLWFFDLQATSLSDNLIGKLCLDTTNIGYTVSGNTLLDFSTIDGKLILVSKELRSPYKVSYNKSLNTFSITAINIKVRDIWGVDDGLEVDEEPTDLSDEHRYNLHNQGWPVKPLSEFSPPSLQVFNSEEHWPSNSGVWHSGKSITASTGIEAFKVDQYTGISWGTSPSPKGKYILDAFNRGESRQTQVNAVLAEQSFFVWGGAQIELPQDKELGRLSTITAFSSRMWYSGVESSVTGGDQDSSSYAGMVFFTQVIESDRQLERCYQSADPTNEFDPDLVASDGGTVKIAEAGTILKLINLGTFLVVIADNGVWSIEGTDGVFRADEFSINKVSNIGCKSKSSIIAVEESLMYWGIGGIYVISPDAQSGRLSATNVSESTIQKLYVDIPSVGIANAVGHYDPSSRKVSWLFNDTDDYDGVVFRKKFNKELVLDTTLQAFYLNEFYDKEENSPFVCSYVKTDDFVVTGIAQDVVLNGEPVVHNGEQVIVTELVRTRGVSQTKYVTIVPDENGDYFLTFSLYNNIEFKDWGEKDAPAYLITGHTTFGSSIADKRVNYLEAHFQRTETGFTELEDGTLDALNQSGCTIQPQWNWADSPRSGKWGTKFQAYRLKRPYFPTGVDDTFDYGEQVITTKSRLRGSGKALSVLIESVPEKDVHLLGWSMDLTGTTVT